MALENGDYVKKNNNGPLYAAAAVACVLIVTLGIVFSGAWKGSTGPLGGALSTVSVSASGNAKGIPSMAEIDLFMNATGNSTAAATSNLSSKMTAFNRTVYGYIGGNTSLVKTQYLNVGVIYSNNTKAKPVYQAQEYVTVTLPQLGRLNGFLANITGVPGIQVQDVSAILSDLQITQLRQQALTGAIANATSQARAIIGNVTIVNTTVSVGGYNTFPYPVYAVSAGGSAGGPAILQRGPLYYNGTSSVMESIQATFYYRK